MHYYEVAPTRIIRAGSDTFTYASENSLPIGQLVRISVGKIEMNGVVIELVDKPSYAVKPISSVLENKPIPRNLITLARWMSEYYMTPLATVLQTVLPSGLEKSRRKSTPSNTLKRVQRTTIVLTEDQRHAIDEIQRQTNGTFILQGVTGSGKTEVYMELAFQALNDGKSVILLVPEIALTSQVVQNFKRRFDHVLVTHSRQTEAERHLIWKQALNTDEPVVVIGPRSALFMPLGSIGLIVIDEAHEPSYKQEQSPRYAAQLVASQLAKLHGARLVLGSATPSVTDRYLAQKRNRPVIPMTTPAVSMAIRPKLTLVDMTKRTSFKRHRFFSEALLNEITLALEAGKQALLFHNRRGSSSVTLCKTCGWQAGCPRCFVPLKLHADIHQLKCHICGVSSDVPTSCPVDGSVEIIHKGIGTKLIESEITRLFPKASVARFDGDSATGQTVEAKYEDLKDGRIDIIVGTQVIAKGLDLPKLAVVGIIQADAGLSLPDFSSSERTFQLLAQAVGRVGRFDHETSVVVQSYQPDHPIVKAGLTQDYDTMYDLVLRQRKAGNFPPFCYLLKLTCSYKTERSAVQASKKLAATLQSIAHDDVQILGPTPSFYERTRDTYRWQLVLKSPVRAHLTQALDHLPPQHWQFELDPTSLL